jgi:hypothetical protein
MQAALLLLSAAAILSAAWAAHAGEMCRGVNWQRFDQAMLLDICECVGGLGLAAVLRLMAEDHSGAAGEAGMLHSRAVCIAVHHMQQQQQQLDESKLSKGRAGDSQRAVTLPRR